MLRVGSFGHQTKGSIHMHVLIDRNFRTVYEIDAYPASIKRNLGSSFVLIIPV